MLSEKCILLTKNDLQMNYSHKFARHSLDHESGERKPVHLNQFFLFFVKMFHACCIHIVHLNSFILTLIFSSFLSRHFLLHSLFLSFSLTPSLPLFSFFLSSFHFHYHYSHFEYAFTSSLPLALFNHTLFTENQAVLLLLLLLLLILLILILLLLYYYYY